MKCKQIQISFYDYADGIADEVTSSAIESHLSGCAACRLLYETQRRLHQSVTNAVASELAGLHFQPKTLEPGTAGADHVPSLGEWFRQTAFAIPALLLLCIILWPLLKPPPELTDNPPHAAYAEAFHYFEMHSTDKPGASGFTMPVAVIVRPGAPARVIELDGKTDFIAAFK